MVIDIVLYIIISILYLKIVSKIYYLYISYKGLSSPAISPNIEQAVRMLIIIPALREQNVILDTLKHLKKMEVSNIDLLICVAGTSREKKINDRYLTTGELITKWLNEEKCNDTTDIVYVEVSEDHGDRASQLNHAVHELGDKFKPDIIGVYDADSLPDLKTLQEVAGKWCMNPHTVFQQPVHFIKAANRMTKEKKSPILVANALNQTTWTFIHEYPNWLKHHKFCESDNKNLYYRNDYLIGHGEFIPYDVYKKFSFPEQQVTDGIQLGYRLSMSGNDICPLQTFCDDDVPQSLMQLIKQHKRWYGGCNRLIESYAWCKQHFGNASICQVCDGYWSQLSWLCAGIFSLLGIVLSGIKMNNGEYILPFLQILGLMLYCYIIPFVAHRIVDAPISVRLIDWLCLPLAMLIKGIGPWLYVFQYVNKELFGVEIEFSKVER